MAIIGNASISDSPLVTGRGTSSSLVRSCMVGLNEMEFVPVVRGVGFDGFLKCVYLKKKLSGDSDCMSL